MKDFLKSFREFVSERYYLLLSTFETILAVVSLFLAIITDDPHVRTGMLVLFVSYFVGARISHLTDKLDRVERLVFIMLDRTPQLFSAVFKDTKFQVMPARDEVIKEIKASRKK